MQIYKGTFEEPKVKMGKSLHEIKAKCMRETSEQSACRKPMKKSV